MGRSVLAQSMARLAGSRISFIFVVAWLALLSIVKIKDKEKTKEKISTQLARGQELA